MTIIKELKMENQWIYRKKKDQSSLSDMAHEWTHSRQSTI